MDDWQPIGMDWVMHTGYDEFVPAGDAVLGRDIGGLLGGPTSPSDEAVLTIAPPPAASMAGISCFMQ